MTNKEERSTINSSEYDQQLLEQVEKALFRRATGYEDDSGKVVQPDVRAAMYWLENRCPERWKKSRRDAAADEAGLTEEENQL